MNKKITIELSQVDYDFLHNLSNELNTQDNRATADPYIYQIKEEKELPTANNMGEEVWILDGEIHLRTKEDEKEAIFEYKEWDLDSKSDNQKYNALSELEKDEILNINYTKVNVQTIDVYRNVFFTEKACKKHISENKHHYNKPVDYVEYAFRNPELEHLIKIIKSLTKKPQANKSQALLQ